VFCRWGRMRVRVSKGTEGFVVDAPGSSVVDLGTEFALNIADDGRARVMVFEGAAEATVLGAEGTPERSQLVDPSKAFEIDPHTGDIKEVVVRADSFVTYPNLVAPPLALDAAYPAAVMEAQPWGYWRFDSMADGATPNEIRGGPPLRATGPVEIADAAQGNGCAVWAVGEVNRHLELDGLWEPPKDPGYAVELWAMSEEFNHSTLVALHARVNDLEFKHFALLELMTQGRYPFPGAAAVRFLLRWPPGDTGGTNIFINRVYLPYHWHHLVTQRNGDRMELYMDGVLAHSRPLAPGHATAPCRMFLGRLSSYPHRVWEHGRPFVGRMDELALYNRPLSTAEVRSHYQLAAQAKRGR
jgi:hypothetical protein